MNGQIHNDLRKIRSLIEKNEGLKNYRKKKGDEASRRFWNLFRVSLSRWVPDQTAQELCNSDSKLAEMGDLGPQLAKEIFDSADSEDLPAAHQALILACLEMDAAWRLQMSRDDRRKEQLRERLDLWRIHDQEISDHGLQPPSAYLTNACGERCR